MSHWGLRGRLRHLLLRFPAGQLTALNFLGNVPAQGTPERAAFDKDLAAENKAGKHDDAKHEFKFEPKLGAADIPWATEFVETHGLKKGVYQSVAGGWWGCERACAVERLATTPSWPFFLSLQASSRRSTSSATSPRRGRQSAPPSTRTSPHLGTAGSSTTTPRARPSSPPSSRRKTSRGPPRSSRRTASRRASTRALQAGGRGASERAQWSARRHPSLVLSPASTGQLTALNFLGNVPAPGTSKRAALDADLASYGNRRVEYDDVKREFKFAPMLTTEEKGWAAALAEVHGLRTGVQQSAASERVCRAPVWTRGGLHFHFYAARYAFC